MTVATGDGVTPIRIVLADDHTVLRQSLRQVLELEADLRVVAEAGDGHTAADHAREFQPDVVLLDLEMPGPGPEATIRELRKAATGARVIILTTHDDPRLIQTLLAAGAIGYLHKSVTRQVLVSAIRSAPVLDRGVFVSRSPATPSAADPEPGGQPLTPREREVLEYVAEALSNRQIGRRMDITEGTVKRHLRNIFTKLEASSRLDAVNKAYEASLIARR